MKSDIKNLIFVDCEAYGKSPSTGILTEFGAVAYPSRDTLLRPHDHNPVHDAMGNLEAFERLLNGER